MRRPRPHAIFTALVLCAWLTPAFCQDDQEPAPTEHPFLWKVEMEPPHYLYGTIHVPDERVLNLPAEVRGAFDGADVINTEIELDSGAQMRALPRMMLPGKKTLRTALPEKTYARLQNFFKSKGFPLAGFMKFKVWVVATQIPMLELLPKLAGAQALDQYLYTTAQKNGKEVGALETLDEQLDIFDSLTEEEQAYYLEKVLDQLEKVPEGESQIETLIKVYLSGDLEEMVKALDETSDLSDPLEAKLNQTLLIDRNVRMADRIDKKLKNNPDEGHFFAVGTAHYAGEKGIIELLRAKGYRVTRIGEPAKVTVE